VRLDISQAQKMLYEKSGVFPPKAQIENTFAKLCASEGFIIIGGAIVFETEELRVQRVIDERNAQRQVMLKELNRVRADRAELQSLFNRAMTDSQQQEEKCLSQLQQLMSNIL
jgi:hypothetical protein